MVVVVVVGSTVVVLAIEVVCVSILVVVAAALLLPPTPSPPRQPARMIARTSPKRGRNRCILEMVALFSSTLGIPNDGRRRMETYRTALPERSPPSTSLNLLLTVLYYLTDHCVCAWSPDERQSNSAIDKSCKVKTPTTVWQSAAPFTRGAAEHGVGIFPCFKGDGWTFMATNILSLMRPNRSRNNQNSAPAL